MATNFGYACICMGINEGVKTKDEISVNRGMAEKTFIKEGVKLAGEKAILNLRDCLRILKYNVRKGIKVYRMSSDMFPWFTHYNFKELPNYNQIVKAMTDIGDYVKENNLRVGCHNGGYSWEESFKLAVTTWGDVKPLCHHSSSKLIHEDKKANSVRDHSDFLYEPFENFDIDVDVELECKMKDVALFKYIKDYIKK